MTPPAAEITQLIDQEVAESARKVRCYGYLARHLRRINDALQGIGFLASSIAIFSVLGGLYWFALDCLVLAPLSFAIPTLRNDSNRSLRNGEISHQLAQLLLEWEDLWNAARTDSSIDVLAGWEKLSKRQLSILAHVPLDLTLSPRLARRAQNALHDYRTPAIAAIPNTNTKILKALAGFCGACADRAETSCNRGHGPKPMYALPLNEFP